MGSMRSRPGTIAWGLGALSLVLFLLGQGLGLSAQSRSAGDLVVGGAFLALLVALSVTGALIATSQPRNPIGWLLAGVGLAAALAGLSHGYADHWQETGDGPEILGRTAAVYANLSWVLVVLPCATFLLLLFPDGRLLTPRWRWIARAAGAAIALLFLGTLMYPLDAASDYPGVDNPYAVKGLADPLIGLGYLLLAVAVVGSALSLVLRFRRAGFEKRQQIKWVAYAGAVVAVTLAIFIPLYDVLPDHVSDVAILLSVLGLPVATGVAILRHRLYDIDLVINRTLVYATLTAGLAGVYAAVSLSLGVAIGSGSTLPTAAATLAVALLFRPLRARVQRLVDRRFDRARYEGLGQVRRFLGDLRAGRAAPEATGDVLADALTDPSLELFFWLPEGEAHVDASGHEVGELPSDERTHTPVRRGELHLATVVHDPGLGERPNLLDGVIEAAGLAIEIARLRAEVRRRLAEVEESRARIVTAGDEERRRLERDLHDGAQQRLVSIGLSLRHVQSELSGDGARQLDAAVAQVSEAIEELRELARGVRPAALDEGLAAALRELASRSPVQASVHATDERFGDQVETAAYFVASEALANAAKHARATEVVLTAAKDNGSLVVSVWDDGVGGARAAGGTGLIGMADRVAALGGSLRIESPPSSGTLVEAELPCES
jgi:signal transduction histidine kinase